MAVVVPHSHWDREWYAPFETLRFQLVQFLDELVETLENEPGLPVFLLDGQSVILEDYLEIRPSQRERVTALVRAGRLRPGPFYVQPDEFHVAGESLVRNLLTGIRVAAEFGWVMREGYLPDTFGHVDQLPQILQGFGISTFYAMRGFGHDVHHPQSQFWWRAPDGSRVLVEWLTESYSNAAVLTPDAKSTSLHHGAVVHYDSLPELLERLGERSPSGVLLMLNGGDHLRVQQGLPATVARLNADVAVELRLAGLEEFHALVASRPLPEKTIEGELRFGGRHDVFTGIGSTRTPMKQQHDQVEAHLLGTAERLDALAFLLTGRTHLDSLRYAWRELLKNQAHDSICGCSVDQVHREMALRLHNVGQVCAAVEGDALERVACSVVPGPAAGAGSVPIVVANPSWFPRSAVVQAAVLPDRNAPLGERQFGWVQGNGVDFTGYTLLDEAGRAIPFRVQAEAETSVADPLDRRKELLRDRITFRAADVPALGTAVYRLVPSEQATVLSDDAQWDYLAPTRTDGSRLDNGILRVDAAQDGTLTLTHRPSGRSYPGLLEILDDGDRGDEYGFGPVTGDPPISSTASYWQVAHGASERETLRLHTTLSVPAALTADRAARSAETVEIPVSVAARLEPGADTLDIQVTVTTTALDHRLRIRFPGLAVTGTTTAETAFGTIDRQHAKQPQGEPWLEPPSGAVALRRFVLGWDQRREAGLLLLTEGLHEYTTSPEGAVDITLLRAVGWLARTDHPLRQHKVGPEVPTPEAQCVGEHTYRFGVHPLNAGDGPGHWHRVAEAFATPLPACAVQPNRSCAKPATGAGRSPGLQLTPADAVLSAFKTAEDADGVIARVFNSSGRHMVVSLATGFDLHDAELCDLAETAEAGGPLVVQGRREVSLSLAPHQIATVRLRPARERGQTRR